MSVLQPRCTGLQRDMSQGSLDDTLDYHREKPCNHTQSCTLRGEFFLCLQQENLVGIFHPGHARGSNPRPAALQLQPDLPLQPWPVLQMSELRVFPNSTGRENREKILAQLWFSALDIQMPTLCPNPRADGHKKTPLVTDSRNICLAMY